MTEELEHLWRLCGLDERVGAAKSALAKFPEQQRALETRAVAEKVRLEAHVKAAGELLAARRRIEQEIEAVNTQQRQLESRQPSVKTNEEYQALTHEIGTCKQKRSDLETKVLEKFEEEEALAAKKPAIEAALKTAEGELAGKRDELARGEVAERAALEALEAERVAEVAALPPATRSRYERVHGSREGRAVFAITKNACGGCFRGLSPQGLQEAKKRDRVLVCDGCGRMLVLPPDGA